MKKHSWRIKVEFTEQRLVPGTNSGELPWHLNPTKPTSEMPLLTESYHRTYFRPRSQILQLFDGVFDGLNSTMTAAVVRRGALTRTKWHPTYNKSIGQLPLRRSQSTFNHFVASS